MSPKGRSCPKVHRQVTSGRLSRCHPVLFTIKPSPPLTPHPLHSLDGSKTTYLCFCCQAWHRGRSALALQARLGLPIRSSQCHVLHLDIHSLEDSRLLSSTSQSHLTPPTPISHILTPSFCVPVMSHTLCPPSLIQAPQEGLTSVPGCPTGISAEWPRSRGALAS